MSTARKRRFLLALPGAFGPTGGIEAYNRLLVKAFHELAAEAGGACETLLLLDDGEHPDERYLDPGQPRPRGFGGSRPRFIGATLERIARFRPDLIVFGHINFGALALASRALAPLTPQWFIVHGVEVWRRMKPLSRLAVRAADRTLAVSDYTRRELVRHNGVDRARVDLLPCALDPFWAASFGPLSDAAPPALDLTRPLIITVARLSSEERHKGIDQILRALPAVAEAIPGVRYAVVGGGDDRTRLEALARELGVPTHVIELDVQDRAAVEAAVAALPEEFAAVDVLVNNAGGAHGLEPAQTADVGDWETMIDTNVKGLLYVTRAILPGMVRRDRGHIVNIGSVAGTYPYPGGNVYGATKAFTAQLSLNLRADLAGKRVRVTSIEPGMAETEFSLVRFKGDEEKAKAAYQGFPPLSADDVAEAVVWCATLPAHVNVNRLELMSVMQSFAGFSIKREA